MLPRDLGFELPDLGGGPEVLVVLPVVEHDGQLAAQVGDEVGAEHEDALLVGCARVVQDRLGLRVEEVDEFRDVVDLFAGDLAQGERALVVEDVVVVVHHIGGELGLVRDVERLLVHDRVARGLGQAGVGAEPVGVEAQARGRGGGCALAQAEHGLARAGEAVDHVRERPAGHPGHGLAAEHRFAQDAAEVQVLLVRVLGEKRNAR